MSEDGERRRAKAREAVRKAQRNRDDARRKLLQQRRKLARRRKRNRARTEANRADGAAAGGPTTHSTVPPTDTNAEAAARSQQSTVPERPKGTSVEPRERLYGLRLHERAERARERGERLDGEHVGREGRR